MKGLSATLILLSLWVLGVPQAPVRTKPPEGLWLSDGYGLLIQFDDTELRTYELTSISCLPSRSAKRTETRDSAAIVFMSGNEIIRVMSTAEPNVLRMHIEGTASDICPAPHF